MLLILDATRKKPIFFHSLQIFLKKKHFYDNAVNHCKMFFKKTIRTHAEQQAID